MSKYVFVLIHFCVLLGMGTGCWFANPIACTLEAVFGVNITLNDSAGMPVPGATLTITEGDYEETLTELGLGVYAGATERAGTYSLRIEAAGFADITVDGLVVRSDVCHVIPVSREIVVAPPGTGIRGVMLAGPQCPVVGPGTGSECDDQPFMGTVIVQTEDASEEITRFTADEDGMFRVPLAAGSYHLVPLPGENGFPFADEQVVEVTEDSFTEVQIPYDTGIR